MAHQVREIEQGWMAIKLQVIKSAGVSMSEINRMDVFDFFVLFNEIEQKNGR